MSNQILPDGTTSLSCSVCGKRMRIRTSWRETANTVFARMECVRCDNVVAATIKPAVIISVRPIDRRKDSAPRVATQGVLFDEGS